MTWQERNLEVLRRMAEDLTLRNLSKATVELYTYHVRRFGEFIEHSLDDATPEEIRSFQLHLIQVRKASWSAFNQTVCGLRFLYRTTLPRSWGVEMIPFGKRPKRLPAVLGSEEVDKLLSCVSSLKHRTLLLTLYAAGLRLGEATALTISDIDSQRMMLRVACGKGNKERLVPMSPRLLAALRGWWSEVRSTKYLFPGRHFEVPLTATTVQKSIKGAAVKAGIAKHVTPHTLRAAHLESTTGTARARACGGSRQRPVTARRASLGHQLPA